MNEPFVLTGVYRHYKKNDEGHHNLYLVSDERLMVNSEDPDQKEWWVRYFSLGRNQWFCRPLASWEKLVRWPDGEERKAFVWAGRLPE